MAELTFTWYSIWLIITWRANITQTKRKLNALKFLSVFHSKDILVGLFSISVGQKELGK